MTDHLALIRRLDDLYRDVVTSPDAWTEQAFADWASDMAADPPDKDVLRHVRKVVRLAGKLGVFWRAASSDRVPASDWVGRVDLALGPQAWRPTLEIGRIGLESDPSPELYEDVARRFRLVHFEAWMAGIGYEDWLATRT